ncbi:MAG: class I SAM-dependent methyltransferase [Methanobacterium sp.]|nr:class I SAM-dependent methyltransferase [Methanobacterium sp.]
MGEYKGITDPLNEINWSYYWQKELKELPPSNKSKDWDNIAKKFKTWMKKDDYPKKLLERIETKPNYSVLDIGCGEGTITLDIAKKVSDVTCIDLSTEMLDLLYQKANKEGINNLTYLQGDMLDISLESIGKKDVVVASRCLNGVMEIETILRKINNIGNNVYLTLRHSENLNYQNNTSNIIKREYPKYPSYMYVCNILHKIGITANVEKLSCETLNIYEDMDEVIDRYCWKMGGLNHDEETLLRKHFEKILVTNKEGYLENPEESSDWILIWWKNR